MRSLSSRTLAFSGQGNSDVIGLDCSSAKPAFRRPTPFDILWKIEQRCNLPPQNNQIINDFVGYSRVFSYRPIGGYDAAAIFAVNDSRFGAQTALHNGPGCAVHDVMIWSRPGRRRALHRGPEWHR